VKRVVVLAAGALALAPTAPLPAQVAVEARAGASSGNHVPAYSGLGLHPGASLSALLEARVLPRASLYATFVRAGFDCTDGLCAGREIGVVTRGFGAGVTVRAGRLPWARAGLLRYSATVRGEGEAQEVDPALGFELAGGVGLPIGPRLRVLPGLYFRSQSGDQRTTVVGLDVGLQAVF
jgi:hypothetical protein